MKKQVLDGAKEYIKKAVREYAQGKSNLTPREIMDLLEERIIDANQEKEKTELVNTLIREINACTEMTDEQRKEAMASLMAPDSNDLDDKEL